MKKTGLFILLTIAFFSLFGQSNILVIDYNNGFSSDQWNNASIIYNRLLATQTSVTRVASIPATISNTQYDQVWIFGNMQTPAATTLNPVITYMRNGGAVYVQSEVSCCNNPAAFADQIIDSTVIVGSSITHFTTKSGNYEYVLYNALKCAPFLEHGAAVRPFIGTPQKNVLYEANNTCGTAIGSGDIVGVRFAPCDMINGKGAFIANGDFNIFPLSGHCGAVGIMGTPNNDSIIDLIARLLETMTCVDTGGTLTLTANPAAFCSSTQLGWTYNGQGCPIIGCDTATKYKWSVVSGEPINVPVNFSCDTCPYPIASPSITTTYTLSIYKGDTALNCPLAGGTVIPITVTPLPVPNKGFLSYTTDCDRNIFLNDSGTTIYDSLQWQSSVNGSQWVDIVGADSTYHFHPSAPNGICYRVKAFNSCGTVYTDTLCPVFYNIPTAAFSASPSSPSLLNVPIQFTDNSTGNIVSWQWDFGDGNTSTIQNPTHTYSAKGTYSVKLVVTDNNGCKDSIIQTHEIIANVLVPNIFTPNKDGQNDLLVFSNLEYYENNLKVFNRWGNLIFEADNYKNDWDGGDASDGTYYFILEVINTNSEVEIHKGSFTISR